MSENKDIQSDATVEEVIATAEAGTPVDEVNTEQLLVEFEEAKAALEKAEQKANENYELALRAKADSENVKRRLEKDLSNAHKFGIEKFAQELLPVLDSLEMGLAAMSEEGASIEKFIEGSEMTHKMFLTAVEKSGVEVVSPQGDKFNPDLHQAMSIQENDGVPPNSVIAVVQKGYTINERLLRPAMVIVSKASDKPKDSKIDEIV